MAHHAHLDAESGEHAVEVDLFKIYDLDGDGLLSLDEIRSMLRIVRDAWAQSAHFTDNVSMPGAQELLETLDSPGTAHARVEKSADGKVSMEEWLKNMPHGFRKALRQLGPDLLDMADSSRLLE